MIKVNFYDDVKDALLKFAVIIARHNGKWVFCKHKQRNTWEVPGGHREPEEEIFDTAKRELYEETGAIDFELYPICVYSVIAQNNFDGVETFGKLFLADIHTFEKELHSEIEKIAMWDELPTNWTYPKIQPKLIDEAKRRGYLPKRDEIKWIFFDVGSTLVDETKVYEERMKRTAQIAGVSYEHIYETALAFYKDNKNGDWEAMKLFGVERTKWCHDEEILYEDAENCLKILSRNYKIGIIANQSMGTADRLEKFGILKYIDLVIASAEEGVSKPDKRIFEIALERSGCKPENAVMIGDRIDNDILPAKQMGMHTIWLKQGFGQYWKITRENEKADYEVSGLSELLGYL